MLKKLLLILSVIIAGFLFILLYRSELSSLTSVTDKVNDIEITDNFDVDNLEKGEAPEPELHPLTIEYLKKGDYPGSDIVIEQTLTPGSNYQRYIVSYKSEGLKIYALLTAPNGDKPETGWPVIIFNHGYIQPSVYKTTERYVAYTDAFSRNGYIVFRSDYRGHGNSEGNAEGGYGSNAYTIDVLNGLASIKIYEDADPERIGMWGHSMGGSITLKSMVVRDDIKAGVIWAGVVGSYEDMLNNWRKRRNNEQNPPSTFLTTTPTRRRWRDLLLEEYGEPADNQVFWNSISANSYLSDISGPLQLHHGTADSSVPFEYSEKLQSQMTDAQKVSEIFLYSGDDHNIAANLSIALKRSVDFFDKYLK